MAEHVHEWELSFHGMGQAFRCECKDPQCRKKLDYKEAETRINATERLSAKIARDVWSVTDLPNLLTLERAALRAYADILEAK